jgi:hypothetical protein
VDKQDRQRATRALTGGRAYVSTRKHFLHAATRRQLDWCILKIKPESVGL